MSKEFFSNLEKAALDANLEVYKIINKYRNRYELGIETGMEEANIIAKFGTIEDIIKDYIFMEEQPKVASNHKDGLQMDLFEVDIISDDIKIISSQEPGISYHIDSRYKDDYEVISNEKKFMINTAKMKKKFGNLFSGKVSIYINENITFKEMHLFIVNSDVDALTYNAECDELKISSVNGDMKLSSFSVHDIADVSTVNGDIKIQKLFVKNNLRISTVSGDIKIEDIECPNVDTSTVSGDITLTGNVESINTSTVSGDIILNKERKSKSIAEQMRMKFGKEKM